MAWGYEKSFIVEHDTTVKRRIDCKDCNYYDSSDKSCMKRPLYLPEDGYNSWRNCQYFELDRGTSNYDIKLQQYREFVLQKKRAEQIVHKDDTNSKVQGEKWLKVGKHIFHKHYKNGVIISKDNKYIKVRFDLNPKEVRQLDIKICLGNGLIKPIS